MKWNDWGPTVGILAGGGLVVLAAAPTLWAWSLGRYQLHEVFASVSLTRACASSARSGLIFQQPIFLIHPRRIRSRSPTSAVEGRSIRCSFGCTHMTTSTRGHEFLGREADAWT